MEKHGAGVREKMIKVEKLDTDETRRNVDFFQKRN